MAGIKFKAGPSGIRPLSTLLATLLALPLSWNIFTGFYLWFSPFIMLNSVLTLKGFVLLNVAAILILVILFVKKRFFCIYMCPVGYACDYISKVTPVKASYLKRIPDISRWIALISLASAAAGLPLFILLDPLSIFHGFFTSFAAKITLTGILALSGLPLLLALHFILPNLWCTKLCPLGGLQNVACDIRKFSQNLFSDNKSDKVSFSAGRRCFLAAGAGVAAGLFLPRIAGSEEKPFFRPPAAVPEDIFNTLCIRCGNCIRSCPTGIIFHHSNTSRLISYMSPEVRFINGYCLEDCNLCSKVCPSGSISPFRPEDKKQIIMGRAEIEITRCWLANHMECNRCQVSCKYDAISFSGGEDSTNSLPVIALSKCTGCGACAVICPPGAIKMIPV